MGKTVKLLAVETATTRLSVALLDGKHAVARVDKEAEGQHAKHLIPAIDHVLHTSGLTLLELQGLAVSIGPGSFTGLRVGLATVMAFRMVTGLPLAAVPTLEALAWNLRGTDRLVCPVLKARRGEVYWALYRWTEPETLTSVVEERVGTLETMAQSLSGSPIVFGEGWEANRDAFRRIFEKRKLQVEDAPLTDTPASAVSVGLAGGDRLARGEAAGHGISPRYVQRAEAELMMERRAVGTRTP
jgi:tRNA threonylcarbamoyladenosine biosynthesis protein TsaB